jgi:FkbM family methyltransferase
MKRYIQKLLKRLGLLERLQNSFLYDLYWRFADPRLLDKRSNEVRFYRNLLAGFQRQDLIFDVGANCGDKTDVFVRLGARVVAVEPDESNQAFLRRRFLSYRFAKKPVTVVGKAVSDQNAVETMWVDEAGSALNSLSRKWVDALRVDSGRFDHSFGFKQERQVHTTTLEDLFTAHGVPCFVKIDVEGYELNVLRGMKHPVPVLSFEVNLPEFKAEGLQCIAVLGDLSKDGKFNYALSCQNGFVLDQWLGAKEFSAVFDDCKGCALEVFWKSGVTVREKGAGAASKIS